MIVIKRLFADKVLRYNEVTEKFILMIKRIPGLGVALDKQVVDKDNKVLKHCLGAIAQLFVFVWEFVKKLLFITAFVWLPYYLFSFSFPLIAERKNLTIIFLFFVICTITGSIVNNVVLVVNKRDYIMTRVVLISPAINCLGKLIYKMITDLVYHTISLCVIGLPFKISILLSLVTMLFRPIGEIFAILMYEKLKLLYNNKGVFYGTFMALSVLVSYGALYVTRTVSDFWNIVVNPVVVIVLFVLGIGAMLILCNYRNYVGIVKESIARK